MAHVYKNRWAPVAEAIQEFDAQALEAEALWGTAIRERTQVLRQCAVVLSTSMEAVIDDKANGGAHFKHDPVFGQRMRANVSAAPSATENPLSSEITAAVNGLEAELNRHMRSR